MTRVDVPVTRPLVPLHLFAQDKSLNPTSVLGRRPLFKHVRLVSESSYISL